MIVTFNEDFALLDRGEEAEERFVAITGIVVDDEGALVAGIDIAKVLSEEAVSLGATRIDYSNCVDMSSGGAAAENDMISVFNGGDRMVFGKDDPALSFLLDEDLITVEE